MKAAFAIWNGRIAPVFDVAQTLQIIEADSKQVISRSEERLLDGTPAGRASHLVNLNVELLVCGAISRPLEDIVTAYGIRVYPFVSGGLEEVIDAWLGDRLEELVFVMPGCKGRARRRRCRGNRHS